MVNKKLIAITILLVVFVAGCRTTRRAVPAERTMSDELRQVYRAVREGRLK